MPAELSAVSNGAFGLLGEVGGHHEGLHALLAVGRLAGDDHHRAAGPLADLLQGRAGHAPDLGARLLVLLGVLPHDDQVGVDLARDAQDLVVGHARDHGDLVVAAALELLAVVFLDVLGDARGLAAALEELHFAPAALHAGDMDDVQVAFEALGKGEGLVRSVLADLRGRDRQNDVLEHDGLLFVQVVAASAALSGRERRKSGVTDRLCATRSSCSGSPRARPMSWVR